MTPERQQLAGFLRPSLLPHSFGENGWANTRPPLAPRPGCITLPGNCSPTQSGTQFVGRRLEHETHEMARKTRNPFVLFVFFVSFVLQTPFYLPATIFMIAAPYFASLFGLIPFLLGRAVVGALVGVLRSLAPADVGHQPHAYPFGVRPFTCCMYCAQAGQGWRSC